MRFGCCVGTLRSGQDPIGQRWLEAVAKAGYDYIELPMAQVMELDDDAFAALMDRLGRSGLRCEAFNNFVPAHIRLTGPNPMPEQAEEYLRKSTGRAAALGAGIIVFGSAGARNVPEGFDHRTAFGQLADFLRMGAPYFEKNNVRIAIEPLNQGETNIIRNLTEGAELVDAADSPRVRLLADYYHYALESDTPEILRAVSGKIIHSHFAEAELRAIPREDKPAYRAFFDTLKACGFDQRCSLEVHSSDPASDIPAALEILNLYR